MNLNIDLREDKFLLPDGDFGDKTYKTHNSFIMIAHLNKHGIYTVNDLINADLAKFTKSNKHYFKAVIQILRYIYLGEELIIDALFNECYDPSADFDITRKKLAKDLRKLGFGRSLSDCQNCAASFLRIHKNESFITMEDCLNDTRVILDNIGSSNLRGFYLDYINSKAEKNIKIQELPLPSILESLKLQLLSLIKIRDNLDRQIANLESTIKEFYSNEGVKHGR